MGVIHHLMCAAEDSSAACVRIESKNRVPLPITTYKILKLGTSSVIRLSMTCTTTV